MRRIIIFICVFIALISCGRYRNTSVSLKAETKIDHSDFIHVLHDSARYGDTHAYSQCHGRYWEVFGEPNDPTYFEALTSRITIHEFDSITEILNKSFGKYTYDDKTAPIDSAYFWMGTKSYTKYYYWLTSDTLLGWGLFEAESGMGYAHLEVCICYNQYSEDWVQELKAKNPLVNDTNFISVYFRFDTIINDYEVCGILYPIHDDKYGWYASENGARLFFHNLKNGKEYVWTDWNENCRCFKGIFMSINVSDIVNGKNFKGFHSGDSYIFHFHSQPDTFDYIDPKEPIISNLYSKAEYQFLDMDFDGQDELLIGYYGGGSYGCTCYEVYEITDSGLVEKRPQNHNGDYFSLDDHTIFDPDNKRLINKFYSGCCEWGAYVYDADENGNLYLAYRVHGSYDSESDSILSDTTYYKF